MKHRGRIQTQGDKLEASEAWSQNKSVTKKNGTEMLDKLKNKIPKKEAEIRERAFNKASRFIQNGPYQVVAEIISKTYMVADTEHERVDIEIKKGTAFTNE